MLSHLVHSSCITEEHVYLQQLNSLSNSLHGTTVFPNYQLLSTYTGELSGVEYLFSQSGTVFKPTEEELEEQIDEGFGEGDEEEPVVYDTDYLDIVSQVGPDRLNEE